MQVVTRTDIAEYPLLSRGKVRDIYEIDPQTLLIVSTDRMSAFDVIMREPMPCKGVVLNRLTLFWMRRFVPVVKNHLLEEDVDRFPRALLAWRPVLEGRSVLARKAVPLPMECIVRGHLAGSAWKEYQAAGAVSGQVLPRGLRESARLDEPLFTPSTKAEPGRHDAPLTRDEGLRLLGEDMFHQAEAVSLALFKQARDHAEARGIIIADTKFEFGLIDGELRLIDEVLTPDSSRFWPAQGFAEGRAQPGFDKQYLRDWLEQQPWDKNSPPPALPAEVIEATRRKYFEAYAALTGQALNECRD